MSPPARIYLDNAATSWPKPVEVYETVDRYQRELGAPVGRGVYAEAAEVEAGVAAARHALARLLGVKSARHIVFAFNGTDALNLAIHGTLRPGDHVVTTTVEHNSVLRPLRAREASGEITVTRVDCDPSGIVSATAIRDALRPDTRLIAISHASNVTGALQPIEAVADIASGHSALLLVDAAQTLGHVPLDVEALGIDLLASSGHKGLLGPLGTGLLYIRPGVEDQVACQRHGGTGSHSDEDRQPDALPDKFESGNHNTPGILGLSAGVDYVLRRGVAELQRHSETLTARLLEHFASLPGLTVHGPGDAARQVGVVSISLEGYDPQEVAATLDAAYQIQVRPGIQCAPLMHRALGTLERGGTLRLSTGPFNTEDQIDAVIAAIREIAAAALSP